MRAPRPQRPRPVSRARAATALVLASACALPAAGALAQRAVAARVPGRSAYPAAAQHPLLRLNAAQLARERARSATAPKTKTKKPKKPALSGNPLRALLTYEAMQAHYYIRGSGLYAGEPFSYLWPFSQALAATVTLAHAPTLTRTISRELQARVVGLQDYLDTNNSGAPEGFYTSSLAAYDGTVAPPAGPGGPKYYDDNDWIGIELVRLYKLTHSPALLGSAEGIMAFEMAGWESKPTLGCPGGIPFENTQENTQRNTVTTAPAAELGLQLYGITHNTAYLQFAEMAYEWVRRCLLQPSGLYADHVNRQGVQEPTDWSYNQGTMIGAGALLYQATGNSAFLYQARQTAAAAQRFFTPQRLGEENPFFPSVYFRNLLYLDSITHDPPGPKIAQAYVNYAWQNLRLSDNVFVSGSPATAQLLDQAAIAQIYGLLISPPSTYF